MEERIRRDVEFQRYREVNRFHSTLVHGFTVSVSLFLFLLMTDLISRLHPIVIVFLIGSVFYLAWVLYPVRLRRKQALKEKLNQIEQDHRGNDHPADGRSS